MRKVAIVGTAPSSVQLAPFDNPEWEIWTCSGLAMTCPRWDRHFELHRPDEISVGWTGDPQQDAAMRAQYLKLLASTGSPKRIVLRTQLDEIPASEAYPFEAAFEQFGKGFASTISYMIALAIMEGADEIGIWGVDMQLESEIYSAQRANAEYLIGWARGAGIDVFIPPESDLCKILVPYAYGAPSEFQQRLLSKRDFVNGKIKTLRDQAVKVREAELGLTGALDVLDWLARQYASE